MYGVNDHYARWRFTPPTLSNPLARARWPGNWTKRGFHSTCENPCKLYSAELLGNLDLTSRCNVGLVVDPLYCVRLCMAGGLRDITGYRIWDTTYSSGIRYTDLRIIGAHCVYASDGTWSERPIYTRIDWLIDYLIDLCLPPGYGMTHWGTGKIVIKVTPNAVLLYYRELVFLEFGVVRSPSIWMS